MFGISFGEILLILLVCLFALKPGDIKMICVQFRKFFDLLNNETDDIKNSINDIVFYEENDSDVISKDIFENKIKKNNNYFNYDE